MSDDDVIAYTRSDHSSCSLCKIEAFNPSHSNRVNYHGNYIPNDNSENVDNILCVCVHV